MNVSEVKQIILGKIGYILMIGLVCAVIAAGYKYCFSPSFSYKGTFQYTRIIQIVNDKETPNTHFEFNYPGVINTNSCYVSFLESVESAYDFTKFNSSWATFNQQDKINWFRRLVRFGNFHNDTYELVFAVSPNNINDLSYLNENIKDLMDIFVKQGNQLIKRVKPDAEIKTVSETILMPQMIIHDKKPIVLNYSVYGFIAGIILSMAVLIGIPLFKNLQDQD